MLNSMAATTRRTTGARKTSAKSATRKNGAAASRGARPAARAAGTARRRNPNASQLVIVESPAKARTIGQFLGREFEVIASMGHVRDLPEGRLGVRPDQDFAPTYVTSKDKGKVIADIKEAGERAERVFLATDPDREGEAIAWHVAESAGLKGDHVRRVVFHSITADAVRESFDHERDIDMELVNAQQARRIEDRLVGFKLSPLIGPLLGPEFDRLYREDASALRDIDIGRLSAGRVQSVALRLVVERDTEIAAFNAVEYWSIEASLKPDNAPAFAARLHSREGDPRGIEPSRGKEPLLPNEDAARAALRDLDGARYSVASVTRNRERERPRPPFTTSTLQQEASSRLGFQATRTMSVAQNLYEGIQLGSEGRVGLITYMRTDSPQVAPVAVAETRRHVVERWGQDYVPKSARSYTTRSKVAQEAHEAIRPTSIARTPESVRGSLTSDQARLYELIWNRMVASQMSDAEYDRTTVNVDASAEGRPGYVFRASGRVQRFAGFRVLYGDAQADPDATPEEGAEEEAQPRQALPDLAERQALACEALTPNRHETKPPPRYTEATLVRKLEEEGIGRPSTYAATVGTIVDRKYVERQRRTLLSTQLGRMVCGQLRAHFPDIMDVKYTSRMENQLDEVANGKQAWTAYLHEFYDPFSKSLDDTWDRVRAEGASSATEAPYGPCSRCGKPMVMKVGRNGPFLGCSGYPECRNTRNLDEPEDAGDEAEAPIDVTCEKCGKPMAVRNGRYGKFLSCTGYPKCKNSRNLDAPAASDAGEEEAPIDATCEKCGKPMALKVGRRGKFLGCTGFPQCKNTRDLAGPNEDAPDAVTAPCPKCDGALRQRRSRRGPFWGCSNYPTCRFTLSTRPLAEPCPECDGLLRADGEDGARCTNCVWRGPIASLAGAAAGV